MSKKITITVHDDIPDDVAWRLVLQTVKQGRISHNSKGEEFYCWAMISAQPGMSVDAPEFDEFSYAIYTSFRCKSPNSAFHVMNYKHTDNDKKS